MTFEIDSLIRKFASYYPFLIFHVKTKRIQKLSFNRNNAESLFACECVCVSFSRIRIPQIEFVIHFIWIYKRKPCWDVITNLKFSENEMQRACDWSAIHTHLMIALLADVLVLVATIWIKVKCVRVWWTDLQILIFDRLNWKSSAFAAVCIDWNEW